MPRRNTTNPWSAYEVDPIEFEKPDVDEPPRYVLQRVAYFFELSSCGYELVHRWSHQTIRRSNIKIAGRVMRRQDVIAWLRDKAWPWVRVAHPVDCSCRKCSHFRATFLEGPVAEARAATVFGDFGDD